MEAPGILQVLYNRRKRGMDHVICMLSKMYDLPESKEMADRKRNFIWGAWYQSGLPLKRFFNTSGILYKEMKLKDRLPEMTEDEQLTLLSTDGMLVKRPILISDEQVLVGFKEKEWETLKAWRCRRKNSGFMIWDCAAEIRKTDKKIIWIHVYNRKTKTWIPHCKTLWKDVIISYIMSIICTGYCALYENDGSDTGLIWSRWRSWKIRLSVCQKEIFIFHSRRSYFRRHILQCA